MVFAVGKCPIGCLVGGLVTLSALSLSGCGGEPLALGTKIFEHADVATSAAASGSPAWRPPLAETAGATAETATIPGSAGAASETQAVSRAGAAGLSGAGVSGSTSASGEDHPEAGSGGTGAGSGRPRRRGGAAGEAVGGGGGRSGQSTAQAGRTGGSGGKGASASAAGAAAAGCVENLACKLTAPESTGDVHQDCVDRVNQFRVECACLPALERWHEGEACADDMAKYDSGGSEAHAGFGDKICEGGSAQNECPGWHSESQVVSGCLQQMWDEGPPPMSDCTGSCFQTYGHFLNMTNQRMTKVACGFYTTSDGQVWSVQNFTR